MADGPKSWLTRAWAAFWNVGGVAAQLDEHEQSRLRMMNAALVGVALICFPFVFRYASLRLYYMAVATTLICGVCVGCGFALRRGLRPEFVANVVLVAVYVTLLLSNITTGGFYDANFGILYVLPLAAALLVNLRVAAIWLAITVLTTVVFWWAPRLGLDIPNVIPPDERQLNALVNRLAALAAVGLLAMLFVLFQSRAAERLLRSNNMLRDESRSVDAMRAIASAANAAETADEAAHRCLALICSGGDWTVGRVTIQRPLSDEPSVVACYGEELDATKLRARWSKQREEPRAVVEARRQGVARWEELHSTPEFIYQLDERTHALRGCYAFPFSVDGRQRVMFELYRLEDIPADARIEHLLEHAAVQLLHTVDREYAQQQIRNLALHDRLTGLPNRDCFRRDVRLALTRAVNDRQVVVMSLDIDRFNRVNEALGAAAGDELLRFVSRRFAEAAGNASEAMLFGGGWTLARLAGDEFALLVVGLRQSADAARVAQRMLECLRLPLFIHNQELVVSASVGLAVYPQDGIESDLLMRNAHAAMVAAKRGGVDAYRFYARSMNAADARRLELETELRQAIEREELYLLYQPIVDTRTGRVTGAEALVRWRRPNGEEVLPSEFIPIAETSGLIMRLGHWVLRSACAQLQQWREQAHGDMRVAVNISARQFEDGRLVGLVERALADHDLPAAALELEITESTLLAAHDVTTNALTSLNAIGVGLALDDFGTGYSSLSYLQRFPVDRLKVDRSFVSNMIERPSDQQLAGAIIAMAHELRLRVVAEGVESRRHVEVLCRFGCDELQGYLFGAPAAASAIDAMLEMADGVLEHHLDVNVASPG